MTTPRPRLEDALSEGEVIDRAAREAVRQALLRHKRLGESIVVWRDGGVVEIPPEEINVGEADTASAAPAARVPDAA